MKWLALVLFAIACCFWLSAAVHGFWALAHLSGRKSFGAMLFRSMEWFNPENFTPRGQTLQKRFTVSFAGFMAVVLLGVVITLLTR
jgi:hypothetical protein